MYRGDKSNSSVRLNNLPKMSQLICGLYLTLSHLSPDGRAHNHYVPLPLHFELERGRGSGGKNSRSVWRPPSWKFLQSPSRSSKEAGLRGWGMERRCPKGLFTIRSGTRSVSHSVSCGLPGWVARSTWLVASKGRRWIQVLLVGNATKGSHAPGVDST